MVDEEVRRGGPPPESAHEAAVVPAAAVPRKGMSRRTARIDGFAAGASAHHRQLRPHPQRNLQPEEDAMKKVVLAVSLCTFVCGVSAAVKPPQGTRPPRAGTKAPRAGHKASTTRPQRFRLPAPNVAATPAAYQEW